VATLKRIGIALAVGAVFVGIAALVALVAGNSDRFYQSCGLIAIACVTVGLIMSGSLFFGNSYPSRAAMTQLPAPGNESGDPVDSETRTRLTLGYELVVGLPAIVIALLHYTT
jgi:hypothetical protein